MPPEILLETLADLIRIKSVNPNYVDGVPETAIIEYIESFFRRHAVATQRQSVLDGRENLIAIVPGHDRTRRIILEAHVDTVSAEGMSIQPFQPVIEYGRMLGRGSCDTKAGLAAMMHAVVAVQQGEPPACDVWLVAAVDEEFSYRGVAKLCESLDASSTLAAIVSEPTDLRLVTASKGLVRFTIRTHGLAAHSAKPHLGSNAIEQMALVIQGLKEDTSSLMQQEHPLLGSATCNVGVIHGGIQVNLVPASCAIDIDRRLLPDESCEGVLHHYQSLLEHLMRQNPELQVSMDPPSLTDVPLETDATCHAVREIQSVMRHLELNDEPIGVPFCSDASKFGRLGIPSVILGPGSIDQAHSKDEFVDCDQVISAYEIYRELITTMSPDND